MGGEHFAIKGAALASPIKLLGGGYSEHLYTPRSSVAGGIYLYIYPLLVYHKTGAAVKSFCKKIREFYLSEHAKKALFMWVKKA